MAVGDKLTELDPILSAGLSDADPLYIVEVSSDKSKKVILSELYTWINNKIKDEIVIHTPHFQDCTPGGSDTYTQSNNTVDFDWVGASGTYEYILPSATAIPYREIRFVNNSTITASDKVRITAPVGETIDGAAFYEISKPYNGCAVWSDGVQWIVIQAKG